jgi:hypothetical protein
VGAPALTLFVGLLIIFIIAAGYGYKQAMDQAGRLPADYPSAWQNRGGPHEWTNRH